MEQIIIETAKEMIRLTTPGRIAPEGAYRYFPKSEVTLSEIVRHNGGTIISTEEINQCVFDDADLYHSYIKTNKGEVLSAWILHSRASADAFLQETLIFKLGTDPELDKLAAMFKRADEMVTNSDDEIIAQLQRLDKNVPHGFRGVLFGGQKTHAVAVNIYKAGGKLSQEIFEPFKGTLGYPKTEEKAINYFSNPYQNSLEAYMAVGELIVNNLL